VTHPPLWKHQRDAIAFARDRRGTLLHHDMGVGKTRTTITLAEEWDARLVLILCPKKVVDVWPEQLREWADPNMRPMWQIMALLKGTVAARTKRMLDAIAYPSV
jgi:SNF2 family DNA or RNA helicase